MKECLKKNKLILKIYSFFYRIYFKTLTAIFPKIATKILYKKTFEQKLDLKNPKGFNEKIQWLKFNEYSKNKQIKNCIDKFNVREYVEKKGLSNILNELIQVYEKYENIDWEKLPKEFVLKSTNGSGNNYICIDKEKIDIKELKKKIGKWKNDKYWLNCAEVQYKGIKNRIICERYLGENLTDYKFFCFNGEPKFLYVSQGLGNKENMKMVFYDCSWKKLNIKRAEYEIPSDGIEKPVNFKEMMNIAKKLSEDFPFVRVDLFNIDSKIYFSELTFVPTGGLMKMQPKEIDNQWGDLLEINILKGKHRK